jgi:hypothetical protein
MMTKSEMVNQSFRLLASCVIASESPYRCGMVIER